VTLEIGTLERWRDRFNEAIAQGSIMSTNGQRVALDENRGIDILGDIMVRVTFSLHGMPRLINKLFPPQESSILNPNPNFYGDLHNMGHVAISYSHDPDHRHLESFAVMGDSATAMRDPIFYRWHAHIDDMFQQFKERLPAYTTDQLTYAGVTVTGVQLQPETGRPNTINTHWQQSDINLSKGMDFVPRGDVFARFTHLQHVPYTINIQANNDSGAPRLGMVRVFLAPRVDERNQQFAFRDHRKFFVEIDKFVANCECA
jgi:tyrosinase